MAVPPSIRMHDRAPAKRTPVLSRMMPPTKSMSRNTLKKPREPARMPNSPLVHPMPPSPVGNSRKYCKGDICLATIYPIIMVTETKPRTAQRRAEELLIF